MSTLSSAPCSVWEQQARSEKVSRLVEVLDAHALESDVSPFIDAAKIARLVRGFRIEHWRTACAMAGGVGLPSDKTIDAVVRVYQRRAEAVADEARVA